MKETNSVIFISDESHFSPPKDSSILDSGMSKPFHSNTRDKKPLKRESSSDKSVSSTSSGSSSTFDSKPISVIDTTRHIKAPRYKFLIDEIVSPSVFQPTVVPKETKEKEEKKVETKEISHYRSLIHFQEKITKDNWLVYLACKKSITSTLGIKTTDVLNWKNDAVLFIEGIQGETPPQHFLNLCYAKSTKPGQASVHLDHWDTQVFETKGEQYYFHWVYSVTRSEGRDLRSLIIDCTEEGLQFDQSKENSLGTPVNNPLDCRIWIFHLLRDVGIESRLLAPSVSSLSLSSFSKLPDRAPRVPYSSADVSLESTNQVKTFGSFFMPKTVAPAPVSPSKSGIELLKKEDTVPQVSTEGKFSVSKKDSSSSGSTVVRSLPEPETDPSRTSVSGNQSKTVTKAVEPIKSTQDQNSESNCVIS